MNNSSSIIKTIDGTVTVTLSNGAIYSLENCSDELYNKIIGCRFDFDKLENLLNPKLSENKKELDDYYKFIEDVKKSNLIVKEGDCFYIKSISEVSVPEQLVKAIVKEELESENSEVINSYLNFWRLCSMNPNSEARTNLFWFLKKWGMKISKSGFIVAFRNAIQKNKATPVDLAKFISEVFIDIKLKKKKSTKDYVIAVDLDGNHSVFHKDSNKLKEEVFDAKKYQKYIDFVQENFDEDINLEHSEAFKEMCDEYIDECGKPKYTILGTVNDLYKNLSNEDDDFVFTDEYSKTTTIKIGQPVRMNRELCDETQVSCSRGLHAGGLSWLGKGYFGDTTLMVLINPSNVVSVPREDDYGKLRCCEYYPIAIVPRNENGNIDIPEFKDSFDDDFLNITLENYGINNKESEKQYLKIPKLLQIDENRIINNLEEIKRQLSKKVVK